MFRACLAVLLVLSCPCLAADPDRSSREPSSADRVSELNFSGESNSLLRSNSSVQNAVARRETSGPDTFAIYGGPDRPLEGRFEDAYGNPSWNGWTSHDATELPAFWHVDTFNAENLNGNGTGNRAMWSGQSAADQPEWVAAPGYGNWWIETLIYESEPVANPTVGQTVDLDFYFNHEIEPLYLGNWTDMFLVEFDSAGTWEELCRINGTNHDGTGVFPPPGVRFSDVTTRPIVYAGNDYGGPQGNQIRIRLRFTSDGAWSDEDGLFDSSAGAVQIDDISLTTEHGSFFEDFEGAGPYLFMPERIPFAGDFAQIYPGFNDIDPCRSNFTPVAGFIDYNQVVRNGPGAGGEQSTGGSTSPGVNYGLAGYYTTNYSGGLSFGVQGVQNAFVSPEILWDLPGTEDDAVDIAGAFLRFDMWQDLPLSNGLFYYWDVRSAQAGSAFGPWGDAGWLYFGNYPVWSTKQFSLNDLLVQFPERIQVRLWVWDLADAFSWIPGTAGTPAPLYDNVSVSKFRMSGIELSGSAKRLPNDSFPGSGSIEVDTAAARDALDVAFDMAQDVNSGGSFVVPGDSITIVARALIPGTAIQDLRMFWALKTNPLFEEAIRSAPAGPKHVNVVAGPAGSVWSGEVLADTCRTSAGTVAEDVFFFELPDVDFMYPGDVIQYYIQATDTDGRVSTLPPDLTGFGEFDSIYPRYGTMYALPSLRDTAGTQASILVLNDRGDEIDFPELHQSLGELGKTEGVDFDIYWKRAPYETPNSNGIGTSGGHGASVEQIAGYSTILYFNGYQVGVPLSDGQPGGWTTKSNDIALLEAWHGLPGRRNVAYFGDILAQKMMVNTGGINYLNNTMGVVYEGPTVVPFIGGNLAPIVQPQQAGFTTEYLTYFYCQTDYSNTNNIGVINHSHITPGANSVYGHKYLDAGTGQPIDGPAASVIVANPNPGVTGYDITFPYSISWIFPRQQRTVGESDRTTLLRELLQFFDEATGGGGALAAPARASLELRVAPNPFNPRTVVSFDVRPGQRGSVKVYNVRGELVRTLHEGEFQTREFTWQGLDDRGASVASGVYVVRATADGEVRIVKTALVR